MYSIGLLSHFSCVRVFATPWTVAHQAVLSMGILQSSILEWVAISLFRGSNCGLLHCRGVLYCLSHLQAHYRFRSYFHSCPILIHLAASGTRKEPLGGGEFFGSSVVRAELAILTVFFSQNWYVYDMIIKPRNAWMKFFFLFYEAESDSSSKTVLD